VRPRLNNHLTSSGWFTWATKQRAASHYFLKDNTALHFQAWNFHRKDLPTLLFIHGYRGNTHWWDFIAPFFMNHYRVVALDLSGMGSSDHREQYDGQTPANDILNLIDHLGCSAVTAVGHSYGGSRLLRACAARPESFHRLVLIDSYVMFKGETMPGEGLQVRGTRTYPDLATGIKHFRLIPEQPVSAPELLEHVARHSLRSTNGGYRWKFDPQLPPGGVREPDGEALLAQISCPVDYIKGENSSVISEDRARCITDALPYGTLPIVIKGGHHHLMFDKPLELISALQTLLTPEPHPVIAMYLKNQANEEKPHGD
jgi:pimeloyl-ACP methyl ester carboxylesterase